MNTTQLINELYEKYQVPQKNIRNTIEENIFWSVMMRLSVNGK
jgi:hypothetical protein